ncbi:hypothetical protein [Phreatobacter sp.]|uniref:hypothetical protein n=1 Tax=Phreatobacter sp. TaxID=1966341 RepID=UPI0022BACC0D|nr:hypothetical protein [Phreatobacter sp.]MCZ8315130.1 hypothetical protein [Phreatobacter sp.]
MFPQVRQAALISTARACGFATLGIVMTMLGLAYDPVTSLKLGGGSYLLTALILILKAWRAPGQPFRSTEVWMILDEKQRPQGDVAQWAIGRARAEAFYRFAYLCTSTAMLLLSLALLWRLVGP